MLPQVEAFLQSSSKVKSFQIIDNDPLDEENYLLKIRCELISGSALQIRLRAVFRQQPILLSGTHRQTLATLG
jgi:hypothetical protein